MECSVSVPVSFTEPETLVRSSPSPYHHHHHLCFYFHADQLILWQRHSPTGAALKLHFVPVASPLVRLLRLNVCPPCLVSREAESGCLLVLLRCLGKSVYLHPNGLQWISLSLFLSYTRRLHTRNSIVFPEVNPGRSRPTVGGGFTISSYPDY